MPTPESKNLLVFGGTSDIGCATAEEFASHGFDIQLVGRNKSELEREANNIAVRYQVDVEVHVHDCLDFDRHGIFFQSLQTIPTVVVCAVGLMHDQQSAEGNPEQIKQMIDTNFTGVAIALEAAAKELSEQEKQCTIVGISSVAGDRGRASNFWYGASKAAFNAFLSGLRQKYSDKNLRVITVAPGFVDTRMTEGMDLPGPLVDSAETIAKGIYKSVRKGANKYSPLKWKMIMLIIKCLPEWIFVKLRF